MTLCTVLAIVVTTLVFKMYNDRKKPKKQKDDHNTRQERAVWARAIVLEAKSGPVALSGLARTDLTLRVHLPGSEPYEATTQWIVEQDALQYVATEQELPVKVDPKSPQYVYPNSSWAKFAEE
jgi:hypothetical protein